MRCLPLPRDSWNGLGRDEDLAERGVLPVLLDPLEKGLFDLVLVPSRSG